MRCEIVHTVPGRVRIRIGSPAAFDHAAALEAYLRAQPGVSAVRLNTACRSAIVNHDPSTIEPRELAAALAGLGLAQLRNAACPPPRPQAPELEPLLGLPLALATAAAATAVGGGMGLAPWLLAGAAVPVFRRAFAALFQRSKLNVDVLDASATAVLALRGQLGTAAVMVWLISLGDLLRNFTMRRSIRTIEGLYDGKAHLCWVLRDGVKVRVKVQDVRPGDEVVVYPGESIPVDGSILSGQATVDQKMLTGESMPVLKGPGGDVFAGTVITEGKLYLRADRVGSETMASSLVRLLLSAPIGETRTQHYEELFADQVVPYSFLGAGASYLATARVDAAASLLIIDFGTGIRIAAPTTVLAAMARAARSRVLVKGGRCLEQLAEIDTVVFDKTGTLTTGNPEVVAVLPCDSRLDPDGVLALAAAAEARLTHPVAAAVVRAAHERGIAVPERESSEYTIGQGVHAVVDGVETLVGSGRFLTAHGIDPGADDLGRLPAGSHLFVAAEGRLVGRIVYSDPLRPEAAEVVQALRARGIDNLVMLTGDHPAVARATAEAVGITHIVANMLPAQKAEYVRALQREGRIVAVVGDGINDSLCLAQADVGIAVHGSSDVARETAHIALLEESLWKVPQTIDIARETIGLIRQNWLLNFYPNCAAIGLTLCGLTGPIVTTLISNGAALLATMNGLRPLVDRQEPPRRTSCRQAVGCGVNLEIRGQRTWKSESAFRVET